MTYIPLARKWRPKCFADLIGQEHIVTPLQNSLSQNKLHHAYLFTGTRGVGKTTVARIFAKALNCQTGIATEPCLLCENCIAIDEGKFFDLIEVDGASRTRVEDTRELIENIQYAATSGGFKIFLIDEVHMLSTHSFNALLKTLEEPPEHVKFLFATTDPQKLPLTILSRCLQFNLKPIPDDTIVNQLDKILKSEKFSSAYDCLFLIAQQAQGSMRDALTLTEQLIAAFPKGFEKEAISVFLGYSLHDWVKLLIKALLNQDSKQILNLSNNLNTQQVSYQNLLHHFLIWFNHCAIITIDKTLPPPNDQDLLIQCTQNWHPQIIHTIYLMIEKAQQELDWAPNHAIGFQMLMLRILHFLHLQTNTKKYVNEIVAPVNESIEIGDINLDLSSIIETNTTQKKTDDLHELLPEDTQSLSDIEPKDISSNEWVTILNKLELDGLGKSAMQHTTVNKLEHHVLHLEINVNYKTLFTKTIIERVEHALEKYFSHPIKVKFITVTESNSQATPAILNAEQKIQAQSELKQQVLEHPFVQNIIENFDGIIIENSMTKI
jgi:DNA polymerase-3 subunit gamma/tau